MPILVECPGCGAKLNAPDSGAGKKVRCPKPNCGTLVPVPMPLPVEEVPVVDAEPAPRPKPAPVRAALDDDDDDRPRDDDDDDDRPSKRRRDDDDEDDRPRARRRRDDDEDDRPRPLRRPRRKRSGTNPAVVVAVVLGLLLLLGGGGYGIYLLIGGGKAAPPKGWTEYTYADAGFKAYFPKEPNKQRGRAGPFPAVQGIGAADIYEVRTTEDGTELRLMVGTAQLPTGLTREAVEKSIDDAMDQLRKLAGDRARMTGPRSVSWVARGAKEVSMDATKPESNGKSPRMAIRYVVTDTHLCVAGIGAEDGDKLASRTINGFFDNIELLK